MSQKQECLVISCLNIASFNITPQNLPNMDSNSTIFRNLQNTSHCVKSVQILSFFWSVFSCIQANMGIYAVNFRIQPEYRKIRTRRNSVFAHFSRSVRVAFRTLPNIYERAFCENTLHKKWSFPLRISSVNVTKSQSHLLKKSVMENLIFCAVIVNG